MSAPAPAPWRHHEDNPRFIVDATGAPVCELSICGACDHLVANARLIAAAPDYHDRAHELAMRVLQSDLYHSNPDVRDAVDNVLTIHRNVERPAA